MKEEWRKVGSLAAPMVGVALFMQLVQLSSTMIVGHLGELALSGASVGTSISTVTGFSLLLGMASGLETLCGQAFGAQQYHKLGVQMHRAMLILLLMCIPVTALWLNMEKLLLLIGQDPAISHETARYVAWLVPGLFAYVLLQPLFKFLQSQSLIVPMMCSMAVAFCLHVPLCWALVYKAGMGLIGAPLSVSLSYWFMVASLGCYIACSDSCKATRTKLSWEVVELKGLWEFFRIAVPSAVMICLEWWSFEVLIVMSGLLPNPQLETSVLSVCLATLTALYNIPYGIAGAASTRVSNELGAGHSRGALVAVKAAMVISAVEAVIVSLSIFLLRGVLGYAFSNVPEVVAYVRKLAPLVALSVIFDAIQGVLSGIARGCGWQHLGAYVNLGAFYIFGIPIGIALAFLTPLRGEGFWIGSLIGAMIQTTLLAIITFSTDWEKQVKEARLRIFGDKLATEGALLN